MRPPRRQLQVALAAVFALGFAILAIWLQRADHGPDVVGRGRPAPSRVGDAEGADPTGWNLRAVDAAVVRASAAAGAVLRLPGGLGQLSIPDGAVARETTFTAVERRGLPPDLVVIDLQPDGLRLQRAARLELAAPLGYALGELEIAAFDPRSGRWLREPHQAPGADGLRLVAEITHLSLRRVRIRPGMNFPYDPARVRGTFFLESDPGNVFEKLVAGKWRIVGRHTAAFRDLVKAGRARRSDLIASGRLRAVARADAPGELLSDSLRQVLLPAGAAEARTGWVRVTRLGPKGEKTTFTAVARVIVVDDAAIERDGPVIRMSRAVMEALGLTWGVDFGVAEAHSELTTINIARNQGAPALRFVPVALDSWAPAAASR